MIGSVERYSSTAGKRRASLAGGRFLRVVIIALILYLVISRFLAATYRIESVSMQPSLRPADRVVVSLLTYGPRVPFSQSRLPGLSIPARGDIVVVQPPFLREPNLVSRILEPIASFLTLQKATLHRDLYGTRVTGYMVKRVIGLPGDTLRMSNYVLSIRPRGGTDFIPEQQLIPLHYQIQAANGATGWSNTFPLSGNSAEIVLKDDEFFVLGDNRPESSDSRSWGPLSRDRIVGKIVYRYWPPTSFGTP
jgi:signal peptidase I